MFGRGSRGLLRFVGVILLCSATLASCISSERTQAPSGVSGARALSDFTFLRQGMSYDEIVATAGEPDRDVGSGMYFFVYTLDDGREVNLTFASLDHLASAFVCNPQDGSREWILGPEGG